MKDFDHVLKHALTPKEIPDSRLDEDILRKAAPICQMKEEPFMRRRKKKYATVLVCALVLLVGSMTAFAAWKYLSPAQVAESSHDQGLADAFRSEDAITVEAEWENEKFHIAFLGLVSGKDLSDFTHVGQGIEKNDRTYCVTAIRYVDGTPIPDTQDSAYGDLNLCVSPLIQGYDPKDYNVMTMFGGYTDSVEDGVLYRITDCDNLEMFADHTIYLAVVEDTFFRPAAYHYNEETGVITRNEEYEGLNALFTIPIDPAKADPEAAANYLNSIQQQEENEKNGMEETWETSEEWGDVVEFMDQLTPENIDQYCVPVESTRQTMMPDSNNYISYSYELENGQSGSGSSALSLIFDDDAPGMSPYFGYSSGDETMEDLYIETFTRNEDGSVTFVIYVPR